MAVVISLAACSGQAPTQGERDRALSSLHGSAKELRDAVAGLTPAQWSFKPSPEVWSAAEVVEHLALIEAGLFQRASVDAMQTPVATVAQKSEVSPKTEMILKSVPDRTQRYQAPAAYRPSGKFKTPAAALAAFNAARTRTATFIRETPLPLRDHILPHPALGPLDAYQWIVLLGAHTERHVNQIRELKARPDFPKGR